MSETPRPIDPNLPELVRVKSGTGMQLAVIVARDGGPKVWIRKYLDNSRRYIKPQQRFFAETYPLDFGKDKARIDRALRAWLSIPVEDRLHG